MYRIEYERMDGCTPRKPDKCFSMEGAKQLIKEAIHAGGYTRISMYDESPGYEEGTEINVFPEMEFVLTINGWDIV